MNWVLNKLESWNLILNLVLFYPLQYSICREQNILHNLKDSKKAYDAINPFLKVQKKKKKKCFLSKLNIFTAGFKQIFDFLYGWFGVSIITAWFLPLDTYFVKYNQVVISRKCLGLQLLSTHNHWEIGV